MADFKKLHKYWERPRDGSNDAELYISNSSIPRSLYLMELIKEHCSDIGSALEIGCNAGRHLSTLKEEFGVKISGVDISKYAVDLGIKTFDNLNDCKFHIGPAQDILPTLKDNSFDLVYSMAVLMHMHEDTPGSFWEDIVRISNKYIITIEGETGGKHNRIWRRNYGEIFTSLGCTEILAEQVSRKGMNKGYFTRIFKVN